MRNYAIWSLPPECADLDTEATQASERLDTGYINPYLCVKPATNESVRNTQLCPWSASNWLIYSKGESIGYGLFATRDIPCGEFIGEYTGLVRSSAAIASFDSYGCIYPNCQDAMHISAKEYGNIIRFINHSTAPNVAFKSIYHESLMHVVCVSLFVLCLFVVCRE